MHVCTLPTEVRGQCQVSFLGYSLPFEIGSLAEPEAPSVSSTPISAATLIFPALYVFIYCFSETGSNVVKLGPEALAITFKY